MKLPLHSQMTNEQIADGFKFISQVLDTNPGNHFRAQAYEEAGVIIHLLSYQLLDKFNELKQQGPTTATEIFAKQLDELPGIGESITAKLVELFTTGEIKAFAKYTAKLPGGMYPLVKLYGIGAKKALKLCQVFKLNDPETAVSELLEKARQGKLREIEGFGEKSEQELIRFLEDQHHKTRIPRERALVVAEDLKKSLLKLAEVKKVIFLGSLRRGAELVGDIDFGIIITDPVAVKTAIEQLPQVRRVLAAGENLIRLILVNGWQVDLKISTAEEWGSFIQHFTGSKEHNIRLREFALSKNLSLSEHGIKDKLTDQVKKFSTEEDFYRYLGLKLIPPAERIGKDEIDQYSLKN